MSACREGANPNNKCRAGNDRAYHRDCFRQRQQEDCCESVVRMPPTKSTIQEKYDVIVCLYGNNMSSPTGRVDLV